MTDDRYTVDDPPEEGVEVFMPNFLQRHNLTFTFDYDSRTDKNLLESGYIHRTPESAKAHAKRMLVADDILKALEMLLRAQDSESPTWREHVTRGARAVVAKARGEVGG
jgi:hypothetical protein